MARKDHHKASSWLFFKLIIHSVLTSTSHVCPLVEPLFIFTRCGSRFCSVTICSFEVFSLSGVTSFSFVEVELPLLLKVLRRASVIGGYPRQVFFDTASVDGLFSSVSPFPRSWFFGRWRGFDHDQSSFSRSSLTESCAPSSPVSCPFSDPLVLGIIKFLAIIIDLFSLVGLVIIFSRLRSIFRIQLSLQKMGFCNINRFTEH